jgi:rRNA-processing protein FCF1
LRCIIDANVLIDLSQGGVLHSFFKLPMEIAAPTVVLDEMIKPDRVTLLGMGLGQSPPTAEQFLEAAQMSAADARLSLGDCAALVAARDEKVALLTGDQRLRKRAQDAGVEVHGVLWVLDEIEAAGLMAGPALAASLRKMLDGGARLPDADVEQRLKRWEQ